MYSSLSSGSAPAYWPSLDCSFVWSSSNESDMYFRKMRPRTTCLYSAASIFLRSLSAALKRVFSKGVEFVVSEVCFLAMLIMKILNLSRIIQR